MAKACFDRIPVNLCLNRSIFNALLHKTDAAFYDNLEELKFVDTNVYTSLKFFKENDLAQFEDTIEQYFVANITPEIERHLKPGGDTCLVTNDNKAEFLRLKG